MAQAVRLFLETTYHPAFRYGGWAFVRQAEGAPSGSAGGERNTTAARLDLAALTAALAGLPAGAAVALHSASPGVLAAARILAAPPAAASEGAPAEDLDLWAQALRAAAGRTLTVHAAPKAAGTPQAFLAAWAEVGRDKAKGLGRFSAAIPRPNLAQLKL